MNFGFGLLRFMRIVKYSILIFVMSCVVSRFLRVFYAIQLLASCIVKEHVLFDSSGRLCLIKNKQLAQSLKKVILNLFYQKSPFLKVPLNITLSRPSASENR